MLLRGGNVQDGKFRIYAYFLQGHTATEKAEFLKHEYGTGGTTVSIVGNLRRGMLGDGHSHFAIELISEMDTLDFMQCQL